MTENAPETAPLSVVVPARNEAPTIRQVVEALAAMPCVDEVVVVDNGSEDGTGTVAAEAGARVVVEARPGMGHAIRAGYIAARNDWVMKADADLDRFDISQFARMIEARATGIGLIKGNWQDPRDDMPMTRYLVMPALRLMFPGLAGLNAPNSGLYAFDRSLIALPEIVGNYAADLDVMLRVHAAGAEVIEVDIGRIANNPRDPSHYSAMAETIMAFILRQRDLRITEEIVVLAETGRQVIGGALGLLAGHARAGGRVTVFVSVADDDGADVLREALQSFPTARIASLEQARSFAPGAAVSRLRVIASHPGAGQGAALPKAVALRQRGGAAAEMWLLPLDAEGRAVDGFQADTGLPVTEGARIKQVALARLGLADPESAARRRELFQSFASLSDR